MAGRMQPADKPLSARPDRVTPDEIFQWERKGRGIAVFGCPDTFALPEVEYLPGTDVLCDPDDRTEFPDAPDRLVLKLSTTRANHLNSLINLIVLPAYRRFIPLYLFAAWDQQELNGGSIAMPAKDGIEEAMHPLLGEQLRTILAYTCVVFPSPAAMVSSETPWLTPVERMLHEGLDRAGLVHRLHVQMKSCFVDALVGKLPGDMVAVETDGRTFDREEDMAVDKVPTEARNIRGVVRFSGCEIAGDLEGCVDRIRAALAGRGCGTDHPPPEPNPGLAGEQAACLAPRAGVVLTLAPAGSGKTRVLTRRVVEAVRGGVSPGRILCVVFNKAASEVMSERIHGDAGLPGVEIRTLHSLGYEVCRQAPDSPYARYDVVTEQSLPGGLTDLYRAALSADFEQHLPAMPYPFPEHLVTAYEEAVSRHRRTLMPVDGEEEACGEAEGFDRRQVRRVRIEVENRMKARGLMTFDEQLYRAVEVLLTNPRARSFYQHRFDAVLVDEVQDLTPVQFLMLRLLAQPLNNLFAVGDDDQMINTFTGADPENIRSFQLWYPGAVIHTLGANYRCKAEIVNRSANVIAHNVHRFDKPIRPVQVRTGSGRDILRIRKCASLEAETDVVVRTIRRWKKTGHAYRDMAVLVRVQSIAAPLQSALQEAGLPFSPIDEGALYQSQVARTIGAYLDVVVHGKLADPLSYAISLAFPPRHLSNEHLREAAALGHRFLGQTDSLPADAACKMAEYTGCIDTLREICKSPGGSPAAFIDALMAHTGLGAYYRRRDETSRRRTSATDGASIDMIKRMADGSPAIDTFVDSYLRSMGSEAENSEASGIGEAETCQNPDRITVTTIHRSKGGEFKGVILFHVVEDILPHRRMTGSEADIEEERRVFYVALTRAEERLCITTQRNRPSRFLAEMKQKRAGSWWKRVRHGLRAGLS